MTETRTSPPSSSANNQDVFIWALYLLGGADKDVDVEDIYVKCFELAPARFGWRTKPEIPDYKKISKALQSIEAKTHAGLVHKTNEYLRRLSVAGVRWVETWKPVLEASYSGAPVAADKVHNQYEMLRNQIKGSDAWKKFILGDVDLEISDVAASLGTSPASPKATWDGRINSLLRASDVLQDEELRNFAVLIENTIVRKMS
jgi:hypothetical protein